MITLLRRQAHALRAVLRRSVLGIAHRGPSPRSSSPPATANYARDIGTPTWRSSTRARSPGPRRARPPCRWTPLAEVEGRDDSILALDPVAPDRTVVRWSDRGIPKVHEYTVPTMETIGPFPDVPGTWSEVPADLIAALAEATATSADDDTRYALSCLLLKAGRDGHEVVATDGRQVLIRGGFLLSLDRRRPGPPLAALRQPGTAPRSPLGDRPDRHPHRAQVRPLDDPPGDPDLGSLPPRGHGLPHARRRDHPAPARPRRRLVPDRRAGPAAGLGDPQRAGHRGPQRPGRRPRPGPGIRHDDRAGPVAIELRRARPCGSSPTAISWPAPSVSGSREVEVVDPVRRSSAGPATMPTPGSRSTPTRRSRRPRTSPGSSPTSTNPSRPEPPETPPRTEPTHERTHQPEEPTGPSSATRRPPAPKSSTTRPRPAWSP